MNESPVTSSACGTADRRLIQVGPTGFEPAVSTPPVLMHSNKYAVNHRVKLDAGEPLHQWLHQTLGSIEREALESLGHSLLRALGEERCRHLLVILDNLVNDATVAPNTGEGRFDR